MPKLQSLYLDSTKVEQVHFDQNAIKLIHNDFAPRWFPLSRISRIVVFGPMLWDSEAINACMEESISLTFSSQTGEIKGICQSINAKQSRFGEMLTGLITQISGTEQLEQWFYAKQRQYKINSLEQIHIHVEEYDSKYIIQVFSAWLSDGYKIKQPHTLFNLLETLLFSHASEFLAHVFTVYQLNEHVTLNQILSKNLGHCIRWLIFVWFINYYRVKKRLVPSKKGLIKFYEESHAKIENEFFHLINDLYHWLLTNEE